MLPVSQNSIPEATVEAIKAPTTPKLDATMKMKSDPM